MKDQAICCPRFVPEPWDDKVHEWTEKAFVKDKVFSLFHIPINFGRVMTRLIGRVERAAGNIPDWLCLSDHTSLWNIDVFLAVDKKIPDAHNVTLSGRMLSKVYEGPFQETGKWMKDFESRACERGISIKKQYVWYTTCPKCAKKHGKNYVVVFGRIA
jgi:hypothetical protein